MEKRPKRRIHKDNPYTLQYCDKTNTYKVLFKDSNGKFQCVEISSVIYELLDSFELNDLAEMNRFDRHIEHSEVYDESLHTRVTDKPMELEDFVIQKVSFEELKKAINQLPEKQKRRIKLYYFEDKTLEEIAEIEGCYYTSVRDSLKTIRQKSKFRRK